MTRRPIPTPADHARMSELVEAIEAARHELVQELGRFYPKTAKANQAAWNIDKPLRTIKSDLEDKASHDLHPDLFSVEIYYGPFEQREEARARLWDASS